MKFIVLRNIMPIRVLVVFEEGELSNTMKLAKKIQDNKSALGIASKKVTGDYSNLEACYAGLKGELSVSGYLGLKMNKEIFALGDGGHDFTISYYENKTIQVKYSGIDAIYFPKESDFISDYGILTQPARFNWVPEEYASEMDDLVPGKRVFSHKNVIISGVINRKIWSERREPMKFKTYNIGVRIQYMKNIEYFKRYLKKQRNKQLEIDSYVQ